MDAFYVLNIGEIALDQGRHSVAAQHFETVAEVWRAAGYRSGTAYVKCNLGRVAAARGRYAEAVRLFQESVDESHAIGSEGDALEARARMAECLLQSGDLEAAAAAVDDALSHARTLGGVPAQVPLLHRVRGVALALAGQPAQASEALAVSLEAARQRRAEYEAALTMRAMAEYGVDADIPRDELRRRAARTLAKLGVVSTPRLPAPGRRPG
jgi:tetratricopeptide (TPR) repeat protein